MSVLRGRPPGLAGGISGSSSRNCSSVRAWPAPKSPTSARSAGVHMTVSQAGNRVQRRPRAEDQPVKPAPSPLRKRALNLEDAPLSLQEDVANDGVAGAVLGGMNLRHILSTGLAATPENCNGVPFNAS